MEKLKVKRVVNVSNCRVCGHVKESVMHALVGCDWAQEVWRLSKFWELSVHIINYDL